MSSNKYDRSRKFLLRIPLNEATEDSREHFRRIAQAGLDGFESALVITQQGYARHGSSDATDTLFPSWPVQGAASGPGCFALAVEVQTTDLEAACAHIAHLMKITSDAGGVGLNLTLPPIAIGPDTKGFLSSQDAINFTCRLLNRLRFESEATGITLSVEAATNGHFLSPTETRDIIDEVNTWAVGVCLDLGGLTRFTGPIDWIDTLTYRIHAIRLEVASTTPNGASGGDISGRPIDLDAIARALNGTAYDGTVILVDDAVAAPTDFCVRLKSRLAGNTA